MPLDQKQWPNDLRAFWMPFTANRQFKKAPRLFVSADRMHYTTADGREVLDGTAGLWCCNAGHNRPKIVEAIQKQAAQLDYSPAFQMSHPKTFELANRIIDIAPDGIDHVFYTNSGSESVDTALKIAVAYHRARGEGQRTRLIGRRARLSRREFRRHLSRRHGRQPPGVWLAAQRRRPPAGHASPRENAFTRGQPAHGAERAEDLERLVALHGPDTIAAVIIEPVAGSTGVLIPPVGYLERIREICDKYGILLIFDEVITGYGRLGDAFAAIHFGVRPDLITSAKGLTNGVIPMGAVLTSAEVHDAFMTGPEHMIELFHGYTYSGNPVACAAALASLETYREEGLFEQAKELSPYWENAIHSLRDCPHVIDIRNTGMVGAVELESIPGTPAKRAFDAFLSAYEQGLLTRVTGDTIALSPPLIAEKSHIDRIFEILSGVLRQLD